MYIGFACMALYLYNIYYNPCRSQQKKLRICLLLTRVRRALPTLRYRSWSLLWSCLPQLWPQLRHCPQLRCSHLCHCWPLLCLPQLRCSHLRHCWPLLCWLQLRHCSTGLSSTCATASPCSAGSSSATAPLASAPPTPLLAPALLAPAPPLLDWPQLHLRHCWPLLCWLQLRHCSTGLSSTCATAGPCSASPRSACPTSTAGPCSAAPTCATAGPSPMGNMAPSVLGASRSSAV